MKFRLISLRLFSIFLSLIIYILLVPFAFSYDLEIKTGDLSSPNGNNNLLIPVIMKTYTDSVVGYRITLESDHPGMLHFIGFDSNQTLSSGWEWINVTYNGDGLQIEALANTVPPPITSGIGYPQDGGVPLVNLTAVLDTMHDTVSINQVKIDFIMDLFNFSFSDDSGNTIGLSYYEPTIDTCWCDCSNWIVLPSDDSICIVWVDVPIEEADTMIIDTILNPYLDTSKVLAEEGTIFIQSLPDSCSIGDVDCTNVYNILDITYLISYLYKGGPEPCFSVSYGDANCSCTTNLLDITCLISYLYKGGSCAPCSCSEWQSNCGDKK
ncbi:MAG: hypothetical protein ABIJ45_07930 [Candidatus Zixiibacteriota bacterium]